MFWFGRGRMSGRVYWGGDVLVWQEKEYSVLVFLVCR